ncbi:MAG: hypothetical protein GY702_25695 [Desulfobulbaceae bacterium]|nr:hypothetical protein [Desulfobulbaceae bacterium]
MSDEEAKVAVQALGFYNWSADQLANKLDADRARLVLVNDRIQECMAGEGFSYFPPDPDVALQQWSGFEHQYGTRLWAERYGLGVTTLRFVQEALPEGLVGAPQALPPVEADEDSQQARYLESLGEDGRESYYDALYISEDACQEQAYGAVPEYEDTENLDFSEIDIQDLRERTLASDAYVMAADAAIRCVIAEGYDVASEEQAFASVSQRVVDSGFESPTYVDYDATALGLTLEGIALLGSLQAYELDLATALWECGATSRQLNIVAGEIALELLVEVIAAQ